MNSIINTDISHLTFTRFDWVSGDREHHSPHSTNLLQRLRNGNYKTDKYNNQRLDRKVLIMSLIMSSKISQAISDRIIDFYNLFQWGWRHGNRRYGYETGLFIYSL